MQFELLASNCAVTYYANPFKRADAGFDQEIPFPGRLVALVVHVSAQGFPEQVQKHLADHGFGYRGAVQRAQADGETFNQPLNFRAPLFLRQHGATVEPDSTGANGARQCTRA